MALTLIVWGIILLISVYDHRDEMKLNGYLIDQLSELEQLLYKSGESAFQNSPDQALSHWKQSYGNCQTALKQIFDLNYPTAKKVYPILRKIDGILTKTDQLYVTGLTTNPEQISQNQLNLLTFREFKVLINLVKEAIKDRRDYFDYLTASLAKEWNLLLILVFVSSYQAILIAIMLYVYQRDFNKQKTTELALQRITVEFRSIFKSIPDAIVLTNVRHEILMVNPAFAALFGYQPEEIVGKKSDILFTIEHRKSPNTPDVISINGKEDDKPRPQELNCRSKNQKIFISETVDVVIKDVDKNVFGFLYIIRDITDRKRAEKKLAEAHNKLELRVKERTEDLMLANKEVKRFAYIVSHDLRAPLVNIKGFSGELHHAFEVINTKISSILPHLNEDSQNEMKTLLGEEIPEALQFIDSSASRMGNLIDSILYLSRLGRRELRYESINVKELVQKILDSLAHQVEQSQVKVNIGNLPKVVADRTSIEQMIGNILENAVKYLQPGKSGEIDITAETNKNETLFHFRDNGRGIAVDDMPKVFEPFSRAGSRDVPGEGMGLAYVQTLVRRHGGKIWCNSTLGEGTTFSFSLSRIIIKEPEFSE